MLRVDRVSAGYGASQVLWDVNLEVGEGEAVALLGRNGVGKTTLLRTIIGLHSVGSGRIHFAERDLTSLSPHERARLGIAYVPQGRGIFPHLSVTDNLAVGYSTLSKTRINAGSVRSISNDAVDYSLELFPALRRLLTRKGGNLSGGEQQQLAIARALVARPRLLLLDEPTEGIQPSIILEIEESLTRVRRDLGVAVLLVEQYLDFAWSFADKYYVMQKGQIVDSGLTRQSELRQVSGLLSL